MKQSLAPTQCEEQNSKLEYRSHHTNHYPDSTVHQHQVMCYRMLHWGSNADLGLPLEWIPSHRSQSGSSQQAAHRKLPELSSQSHHLLPSFRFHGMLHKSYKPTKMDSVCSVFPLVWIMSSNRKTQPKASNVLIRLHVLKKKQVTPSFSWEAPKGRPGEQSTVGKMHCLEKNASKSWTRHKKNLKYSPYCFGSS